MTTTPMTTITTSRLLAVRRRVASGDAGTSLLELLVGMAVMGVFMAIFTGAIISMARTLTKVEAVTGSASQVNSAFLRLDSLVRYASAITPVVRGPAGSPDWYVALESVNGETSVATCTQLRVDAVAEKLQMRTWTVTPTGSTPGLSWTTLASHVRAEDENNKPYEPFASPAQLTKSQTPFQRLTVTLVAGSDRTDSETTTTSSMTFTALNSSASDSTSDTKCQQPQASDRAG